jgi:hypothetical protein
MYNHTNPTQFSEGACARSVGKRATLILTGVITEGARSEAGPFVKFQPDDRFGFGDFRIGIDLDALLFEPEGDSP